MKNQRPFSAAILILILHITTTNAAKNSARPVHEVFEVINEQARIDDKKIQTSPGLLPYGNPLAGNSQHNAKLHAQNQQAMFNAERVRQHRAQLQRLNKGPTHGDSYMRAYHESQESHQMALEQQQANLREKKPLSAARSSSPATRSSASAARSSAPNSKTSPAATRSPPVTRPQPRQRQTIKRIRGPNLAKIMQEEAGSGEKNRNHRSYGSVEYQQYLQPQHYKAVYASARPTYDEGVTIKPNGNVGVTSSEMRQESSSQLLTQAIPSRTQYVYPKQYRQMQQYHSAQDIASLNSILQKEPEDQLSELNALIDSDKQNNKELETPVDLYFYLKNPSLAQHYAHSMYAQLPQNYASAYMQEVRDHTPITEEVDDVEDPNTVAKRPFTPQPTQVQNATPEDVTANINYYSVQPTVATNPEYYTKEEQKPSYQALRHERPLTFYGQDVQDEDSSERYLHHNAKPTGVQHLNEDGTGVSAYGDDNLQYAANYEFGYHVRDHETGNDFGHHEKKNNGNTAGHYHVLLPDGRMQNVNYHAGPDGFHADITYDLEK